MRCASEERNGIHFHLRCTTPVYWYNSVISSEHETVPLARRCGRKKECNDGLTYARKYSRELSSGRPSFSAAKARTFSSKVRGAA